MGKMIGLHHIILHFIETVGNNHFVWIFLCIHRVLFQTDIQLRKSHGRRVGTDCGPELHVVVVFHGADLDSPEVIQGRNGFGRGHYAEILIGHTQKADSSVFIDSVDLAHEDLIIQNGVKIVQVREDTGQIEQSQTGQITDFRRGVLDHEGNVAALDGFQQLRITAHGGIMIYLNFQCSAGQGFHLFGKFVGIQPGNGIFRRCGCHDPCIGLFALTGGASGEKCHGHAENREDQNSGDAATGNGFHVDPPFLKQAQAEPWDIGQQQQCDKE